MIEIEPKNRMEKTRKGAIFPELSILNAITERIGGNPPDLSEYFLIAGQHALDTTGSLLEWLRDVLHLPMSHVYLVGKSYSTSASVAKRLKQKLKINYQLNSQQVMLGGFSEAYDYDIIKLWEKAISKIEGLRRKGQTIKGIFILDDGGHLFSRMLPKMLKLSSGGNNPIPIIGIEQTSSGIFSSRCFLFPIIEVATSAAKQLEAPMLAALVESNLNQSIKSSLGGLKGGEEIADPTTLSYGIIGLGNVGAAMLAHYQSLGYKNLVVYDNNLSQLQGIKDESITVAENLLDFLEQSDVILGCTGKNFMARQFAECLNVIQEPRKIPRIFVSLSSKDTEFNALLLHIHQNNRNGPIDPLVSIYYPNEQPQAIILAAGMPYNFLPVNSKICDFSIPKDEIQLTRGLLAVAILQAYWMMQAEGKQQAKQYQLDLHWQRFVVNTWRRVMNKPLIPEFENINWIEERSGGEPLHLTNPYFLDE